MKHVYLIIIAASLLAPLCARADLSARFSGGVCASQGSWLQTALEQSAVVVNAINTLKDDPNCKAMVNVLNQQGPSVQQISNVTSQSSGEAFSFSGYYRQLQAVGQYLQPSNAVGPEGLSGVDAKKMVQYLTFRTSLDAVQEIQAKTKYEALTPSQKLLVDTLGQKMQTFLKQTKQVTDMAVSTTESLLSALPKSKMCFQNKPSEALTVFSALVNAGASLVTGGQITSAGPFIASVMSFSREMKFVKNLSLVEYERYKASVSCLVESTQESYCALEDAQESLDFLKGKTKANAPDGNGFDPVKNPMGGMMILLRDVPTISAWFQKVLFGIDPQKQVDAEAKNDDWDSFLSFVKDLNTLPAAFREKKQIYLDSTTGASKDEKFAQIKKILDSITSILTKQGNGSRINFFTQAMNPNLVPFYLMGRDNLPTGFDSQNHDFDYFFNTWTAGQQSGDASKDNGSDVDNSNKNLMVAQPGAGISLSNPDEILNTIEFRINEITKSAQVKSSIFFSNRMVVDPQNLILEGMSGMTISPYRAMHNLQAYFKNLSVKLKTSRDILAKDSSRKIDMDSYDAILPMLQDTIDRLEKIMTAMSDASKLGVDGTDPKAGARKAMDVIYQFADMLASRDSFLSSRTETAVRMDINDTLWRHENMNDFQGELLASTGKEIVDRLSRFFSNDPVVQRLDISQATPIMLANLTAVENLFAAPIFKAIEDLNCAQKGGVSCAPIPDRAIPVGQQTGFFAGLADSLLPHFDDLSKTVHSYFKSATTDSTSMANLKAKLCIQSLGFEDRDKFKNLCRDSVLVSEMSDDADANGLNANYNKLLAQIQAIQQSNAPGKITNSRTLGVCALRSYIRKNYIQRLYQAYHDQSGF